MSTDLEELKNRYKEKKEGETDYKRILEDINKLIMASGIKEYTVDGYISKETINAFKQNGFSVESKKESNIYGSRIIYTIFGWAE